MRLTRPQRGHRARRRNRLRIKTDNLARDLVKMSKTALEKHPQSRESVQGLLEERTFNSAQARYKEIHRARLKRDVEAADAYDEAMQEKLLTLLDEYEALGIPVARDVVQQVDGPGVLGNVVTYLGALARELSK